MMNKAEVVELVRAKLKEQFDLVKRASDAARQDATDEESRARSKYETQGLETSYLAAGQAARAEDLAGMMLALNAATFPPFQETDPIADGALVEVEMSGESDWFLLAPSAGGFTVEAGGNEVTVLSPGTPLRKQLQGLTKGREIRDRKLVVKSVR